jgi:hypothetical protein
MRNNSRHSRGSGNPGLLSHLNSRLRGSDRINGWYIVILALCLPLAAQAASNKMDMGSVCLNLADIDHTEILDDQTVLFHMRDGAVWENMLPEACTGLKAANGFDFIGQQGTGGQGKICGNIDLIHVANSDTSCAIGAFLLYQAKP